MVQHPHTSPELLATRAFGLPELFADDLAAAAARHAAGESVLVACAGCYPTATSLGAFPAVNAGWMADGAAVVVDAISGVTGAASPPTRARITAAPTRTSRHTACASTATRPRSSRF